MARKEKTLSEICDEYRKRKVFVEKHGEKLYVHLPNHHLEHHWIHKRNIVNGFSPSSRRCLLRWSATIDWRENPNPLFLTVTLPDSIVCDSPDTLKAWRDELIRSMEIYLCEELPIVWRVEWETRKSGIYKGKFRLHLHLCVFTVGFIPYAWLNRKWKAIICRKGYCRTEVRRGRRAKAPGRYLAKYCAKVPDDVLPSLVIDTYCGTRVWGKRRPEWIETHPNFRLEHVTDSQLDFLLWFAAQTFESWEPTTPTSFTLLYDRAERCWDMLNNFPVDKMQTRF